MPPSISFPAEPSRLHRLMIGSLAIVPIDCSYRAASLLGFFTGIAVFCVILGFVSMSLDQQYRLLGATVLGGVLTGILFAAIRNYALRRAIGRIKKADVPS